MDNPWENISFGSQRRIRSESPFNFFWIVDANGHYGLFVCTRSPLLRPDNLIRLRGITIVNQNAPNGEGELILIMNNNGEWELFLKLCWDLVQLSEKYAEEQQMADAIYRRLRKWQEFLKQNSSSTLSINEQMGLFTELSCLLEFIIHRHTEEQAINSWTGADFDKQDFSLPSRLVEVKSYISSREPFITISSLHQLDNSKKPLYLLVYGLTSSTAGMSFVDIVENIESAVRNSADAIERFHEKLASYGYVAGFTAPPFYQFVIDRQTAFFIDNNFPRLTPMNVPQEINSANYTLDILKCMNYRVDTNTAFNN